MGATLSSPRYQWCQPHMLLDGSPLLFSPETTFNRRIAFVAPVPRPSPRQQKKASGIDLHTPGARLSRIQPFFDLKLALKDHRYSLLYRHLETMTLSIAQYENFIPSPNDNNKLQIAPTIAIAKQCDTPYWEALVVIELGKILADIFCTDLRQGKLPHDPTISIDTLIRHILDAVERLEGGDLVRYIRVWCRALNIASSDSKIAYGLVWKLRAEVFLRTVAPIRQYLELKKKGKAPSLVGPARLIVMFWAEDLFDGPWFAETLNALKFNLMKSKDEELCYLLYGILECARPILLLNPECRVCEWVGKLALRLRRRVRKRFFSKRYAQKVLDIVVGIAMLERLQSDLRAGRIG